ncbi:MAG: M20/M25/M40 family metallo-hydrolase [Thermoplasmata archaeon]|nr:M20/M25/M40 family metallo-hydrolase [Thermoplasmata archaeon]
MTTIDLLKELISIPSILGDTEKIENFVASQISDIADLEFIHVPGKGRCVLATVEQDPNLPTIFINGHLDTVEVCNGWTYDPFKPRVDGDRLYGLGSADMKAGVAVSIEVFRKAAERGLNVIFAGTIDEEGDSAGAFALKDLGIKADICLITEPSNEKVMLGCRGRYVVDVDVRGKSAHGAVPEKGVNAITEAGRLLARLDELPLKEHDILGRGSVCPLGIAGGTRTLSVPEECRIVLDRHVVPGETKETVVEDIRNLASSLKSQAVFSIGLNKERQTPFLEPYITSKNGLVKQFMEAVREDITYGKSVGDYNVFSTIAPTIVHGPIGDNWHSPDEWVSISSVERVMENYIRFLDTFKA